MARRTLRPGEQTKRGEVTPGGMKAVFTIHELAELMGIPYRRTWSLVKQTGVKLVRSGDRILIPLSSFRIAFPEVWDSILLVQQHRRRASKKDEDDED